MQSVTDFRVINFIFNILCYQPFFKKYIFFTCKVLQIILLCVGICQFVIHRDSILYNEDKFGNTADRYKFYVTVFILVTIIFESLLGYKSYDKILKLCLSFEESLKTSFKHQVDISLIYRKIQRKVNFGVLGFILLYVICEAEFLYRSIIFERSRLFYIVFLIPTFIFDLKALQLIFYMTLFESYLKVLRQLVYDLNQDVANNQKLKSKAYDAIIRRKFRKIIGMHSKVLKMVDNFNSSLAISQLSILITIKFYLIGDFYWVSFVFLHRQIRPRAVFGELE